MHKNGHNLLAKYLDSRGLGPNKIMVRHCVIFFLAIITWENPMAVDQTVGVEKVENQAEQQAGQEVRLRIDERNMPSIYANAFRTNGTAEEVMLDFGLNVVQPTNDQQPEILFQVQSRVILTYFSAKRLALTLGQLIRRHEEQFGELELDVSSRRRE